ncbi:hypothetical protein [uncultured Aquincola sp.]|uniref:hypothetical protein n=1 Tax=uncultured Aquincola sp. TaxID=886556 RepID=UPI0032B247E6
MHHFATLAARCLLVLASSTAAAAPPAPQESAPPLALAFSDFFVQPIGPRGVQPTPELLAADGQQVRLVGHMVQREQPQPGQFLLTPRPVTMAEHADGEADDLPAHTVTVVLPPPQQGRIVAHVPGPLALTGRLAFGPAEDATGRVSWIRLYLPDDALAPMASTTPATHRH